MKNSINEKSANVAFISVTEMIALLQRIGTEQFIAGLVEYLEQDYRQWGGV